MKKRKIIAFLCVCCFYFCCISIPSVSASTQRVSKPASFLNVTRYQQEKTNWCWAACAKMVAQYKCNRSPSQSEIVTLIKWQPVNERASDSEVTDALLKAMSFQYRVIYSLPLSYSAVKINILAGDPMVFKFRWNSGGAHVVVVDGYSEDNVRIVDPAIGCSKKIFKNFESLKTGAQISSGTGKYIMTWYPDEALQ